jgi:hypothetical protein
MGCSPEGESAKSLSAVLSKSLRFGKDGNRSRASIAAVRLFVIGSTSAYLDFGQASFTLKHYAAIPVGSCRLRDLYA